MQDLLSIGTSRGCEMIGTGIGLGLSGFRLNPPGIIPTLDLNFASSLSLTSSSGITPSFSRASTGTYFNSAGVLTSAAVNGPRFDHAYENGAWVSKGLLIEEQRTNLVTYSEQLNDASWGFTTNTTITSNAATAPDGTATADLLYPTASSTVCETGKSVGSVNTSLIYTNSFFLKASGKTWARILSIRGDYGAWFNLSNGTIGTTLSGSIATIQNVGNGWYRCSVTRGTDFGTGYTFIRVTDGDSTSAITKNGTDGILAWGSQSEQGSFSTSYIPTTTSAVTRSADVCQITGTDFSSFWNASEGSFVAEWDFINTSGGTPFTAFSTASALMQIYRSGTPNLRWFVYNGTTQADFVIGNVATVNRAAVAYKSNDFAGSSLGGVVGTDTSGSVPTANKFNILADETNAVVNGHIARLRYYNSRLTNSQLQGLST